MGTPVTRLDLPELVTGEARFGLDVKMPGMLYACMERPPSIGDTVMDYDASKALAVEGVRQVVEVPPGTSASRRGGGTNPGVAVVADSTWKAIKGRQALDVRWNEPNAGVDQVHLESAYRDAIRAIEIPADVQEALGRAAVRVAGAYEAPFLHHATMEPMNCTADVREDFCEVWAPTQSQGSAQTTAAAAADLPVEQVRVHTTAVGGGFGRRLNNDYVHEATVVSPVCRPLRRPSATRSTQPPASESAGSRSASERVRVRRPIPRPGRSRPRPTRPPGCR